MTKTLPHAPLSAVAHLGPVFFRGRATELAKRLDELKAMAAACVPSQQDASQHGCQP